MRALNKSEDGNSLKKKGNNWGEFAKACFYNLIYIIIFGVIGANFIHFSSMDESDIETFFPTSFKNYFQNQKPWLNNKLSKIGIPPSTGWPYTLKQNDYVDLSEEGIKSLFAMSVASTYVNVRGFIKTVLLFFSKKDPSIFSNDLVQMLVANFSLGVLYYTLPLLTICLYICFFIFSCSISYYSGDILVLLFTLCCFCFGPAMWFGVGLAVIMTLQFFLTFIALPLYDEPKSIGKHMFKASNLLMAIFGLLCVSSTWKHLDDKIAGGATFACAIMVLGRVIAKIGFSDK